VRLHSFASKAGCSAASTHFVGGGSNLIHRSSQKRGRPHTNEITIAIAPSSSPQNLSSSSSTPQYFSSEWGMPSLPRGADAANRLGKILPALRATTVKRAADRGATGGGDGCTRGRARSQTACDGLLSLHCNCRAAAQERPVFTTRYKRASVEGTEGQ